MNIIALIIFAILIIIALIHLSWAFGSFWPARDEYSLVQMVIGEPDIRHMPSRKLIFFIAIAFFLAALFALWGANIIMPPLPLWIRELVIFLLAFIFATRGLAPFLIAKQLGERVEPFKSLDKSLFAPISILISIGFIILLVNL